MPLSAPPSGLDRPGRRTRSSVGRKPGAHCGRARLGSDEGRYQIGLRLWEVGVLAPRGLDLRELAMPFLEDVYEVTRQNVQLAVLDGTEALYLERLSGRGAVNVVTRVGSRLPLHATGAGLVLLAHADPELQEQVLAAPLKRFTAKTLASAGEVRRALAETRAGPAWRSATGRSS
jgi:DNA-binding IclR family transcriptional regulator